MFLWIDMFDIQHYQVGHRHQLIQLGKPFGIGSLLISNTGGIDTGMDILLLCQTEQIQQEIHLHQRFPTCHSDAAAFIEADIAFILFNDV